jgi:hypothetical protein
MVLLKHSKGKMYFLTLFVRYVAFPITGPKQAKGYTLPGKECLIYKL